MFCPTLEQPLTIHNPSPLCCYSLRFNDTLSLSLHDTGGGVAYSSDLMLSCQSWGKRVIQSGQNCKAQPAIVGKRAKAEAKVDWKIVALPVKLDGKIKGARQEDFLDLT